MSRARGTPRKVFMLRPIAHAMAKLRFELVRRLGIEPGWPGRLVTGARRVVVICVDPTDPPPLIVGAAEVVVVADHTVALHGAPVVERLSLADFVRRANDLGRGEATDVVIHSLEAVRLGAVVAAVRLGARRVHFTHAVGASLLVPAPTALALGALGSASNSLRRALDVLGVDRVVGGWDLAPPVPSRRSVRRALALATRRTATRSTGTPGTSRSIVHYIGDLGSGGAERQLAYLASAQARRGDRVTVVTALPLVNDSAHYAPELVDADVEIRALSRGGPRLPSSVPHRSLSSVAGLTLPRPLADAAEAHPGRNNLARLAAELQHRTPDVLHCWLDEPNAVGALAGMLSSVPRIVLSTRNVSPSHFPRLCRTWYRASYRMAAHAPCVRLVANSFAGANDYARWCGIDPARFHVIYNGVAPTPAVPEATARALRRAELGIPERAFVVVGVFRLANEKRPFDFLEVVSRARTRIPSLHALHLGVGPIEHEVRQRAHRLGLDETLVFLGRRSEPARWISLADVTLLTSELEGCPNVALESQALGIPILLTRAAGAIESIIDEVTGLSSEVGDVEGLADQLVRLATDSTLATALGHRGPAFVARRFGLDRMLDETNALYD